MSVRVIEEDNIKLQETAEDWQDAVRKSGRLLVAGGYIHENYINDVIDSVYEYGPYIVITPGVALAHARPGINVFKEGLSLLTLETPVDFGSEMGPIDIVITLAAADSESHLGKLRILAELLSHEASLEKIRTAKEVKIITQMFDTFKTL